MTSSRTNATANSAPTTAVQDTPWYELINEVPEPLEDGMVQDELQSDIKEILKGRYAKDPTVFVSGPLTFVIYDSETPGSFVAPDCFIVFGVDADVMRLERDIYRIDEWGVPPAFVLEVASPSTAARDLGVKREIYARMGAQEYWRVDRTGENYGEPLVGERLVDGEYVRLELHTEPDGEVWSRSELLGVDFYYRVEDGVGEFSLRDSATGEWLNTLGDEIAARQAAEAQAQAAEAQTQAAEAQTQAAEARNRELQAEIRRLRQQLDRQ